MFTHEAPAGDHTQSDIYTVNKDGTGLRRLTDTPNRNEFDPVYNAAGTKIAYWRTFAPFGFGSIWVMDADGSHQRRLTHGIDARNPVWNPQGTRLAYTGPGATQGDSDIWTLRVSDGQDRHRVTSNASGDFEASWSPDGTRIAFTRGVGKAGPNLFVVNLQTHKVKRVTNSPAYDHQVTWTPGGNKLVFERDFDRKFSIFVVNADGSHLTRLTGGRFFDTGPAVSPDGKLIAFGSDRGGTFFDDLWVMNSDGTRLHILRREKFSESFPDWQPLQP